MSCPDAPLLGRPVRRLVGLKACGQRASRSLNPLVRDRGPMRCHPRPGSAPSPWVLPPVPLLTPIQPARFSFFFSFFTLTILPPHLEVGDNFLWLTELSYSLFHWIWWAFGKHSGFSFKELSQPSLSKDSLGDFSGSPVVRTLYFHCRGHRYDPWSGN